MSAIKALELGGVAATEQEVASHANKSSSANSDSGHFVGPDMMLWTVVPIMIFSLCVMGR
jgi:hypothetical protein